MARLSQPWIGGGWFDLAFILGPPFAVTGLVLALRDYLPADIPTALWALLIVGVDVAHVYGTLYRTYFDRAELRRRPALYVLVPLIGFLAFACLYSLGSEVFWRGLAYFAVYHFVRQQYGFMMIYRRQETRFRRIDQAAIYAATVFPLVWWHTHERRFNWFVDGDFVRIEAGWLGAVAAAVYAGILLAYAAKEAWLWRQSGTFNLPRNLLLAGTALSWGIGIVALDNDLAFTAINVVAHGVPCMGLVWIFGRKRAHPGRVFAAGALPVFLGLPLLFAYLEEGLWDGLVWTDHPGLFSPFALLPVIDSPAVLTVLVPLLALPQITHYGLDAFIWRLRRREGGLGSFLPGPAGIGPHTQL